MISGGGCCVVGVGASCMLGGCGFASCHGLPLLACIIFVCTCLPAVLALFV